MNEDATIQAAIDDVILYQIDCEKGEGIELAKRFGIRGYPTFKMVDAEGNETDRWIGYDGPDAWAATVALGRKDARTLEAKQAAYDEQPTADLARSLSNAAATVYDFAGAVKYLKVTRELDPDHADDAIDNIFYYTYYGSQGDDPAFGLADLEEAARPAFDRPGQELVGKLAIAGMVTGAAKAAGQPEHAVPYLKEAMAASEGNTDEDVAKARGRVGVDYALLVEHDNDKAVTLKKATMPEGWQDDARRLNSYAWWCFENGVDLEEAQALSLKSVELASSDQEKAGYLDTAAELCNALGNCDEAIAKIKEAASLDPENAYYKDQLAKFEQAKADKKG